MKQIKCGDKTIELNVGDFLTVKEMRQIYPVIKKYEGQKGMEFEMTIEVVKILSPTENVEEIIDGMNADEFNIVAVAIAELIDQKKKPAK